ncbi:predicted protein, partial [Nematostella vectensis]
GGRLSEFIKEYDTLSYNSQSVEKQHGRHRRSVDPNSNPIILNFLAHERKFKLRLRRDTSIFADDLVVENYNDFDPSKVVAGEVLGHKKSLVHGFILDGVFEGKIHIGDDEYHVEHSSKYFKEKQPFHSVIYHTQAVEYPYPYGRGCGLSDKIQEWMQKVQRSAMPDADLEGDHSKFEPVLHRYRRAASGIDPTKKTCRLYMQADHLYTEHVAQNSKERAILQMTDHVRAIKAIYQGTDFDGDGNADLITFVIQRFLVNGSSEASNQDNPFRNANIGVAKLLELNSQQKKNEGYCLSYIFTYRDFDDGVLGLAWVGDTTTGSSGGICENWKSFTDGHKILNTGVVTFINYGKDVPQKVSEITFAHEAGHNFGSPHDPEITSACSPGDSDGNYIMFPRATSGEKSNNRKFSTCSRDKMYLVLQAKGICDQEKCCFKDSQEAICGNRVVEEGESCDCGYQDDASCTADKCCLGSNVQAKTGCTYKNGATCSPSQGLCCNGDTCSPYPGNSTFLCQNETECRNQSFCNGINATCPLGEPKPHHTICEDGRKLCINGTCQGSICMKYGYKECQCTAEPKQCDLCCDVGDGECKSTSDIAEMTTMTLHAGSPCDNFNGYCDVFLKCRKVDADGPLNRLRKIFFSKEAIMSYIEWIKVYWWAVVLIGVGLIIFMAVFIKLCSVHTPSSNPNLKPARQLTLRRSQQQHGQGNPSRARQQARLQ